MEIANGAYDTFENVIKNAPHTASAIISDVWPHPYSREKAAFPLKWIRSAKFWPSVGKIDNAYGNRNLVCSCEPIASFLTKTVL